MDIWNILDIEATKDKDTLKNAYRKRLAKVNPEDDPEGFKELRSAYEEAVRLADENEEVVTAPSMDTVAGRVNARLENIYNNFQKRIDDKSWRELFLENDFVSIDTAEEAFEGLLHFLMGSFFIPHRVWSVIVNEFEIKDRVKELKEKFPSDFLNYMISNATYEDIIDYSLFSGDEKQADKYIDAYYLLDQALGKHDIEKQEELIERLEKLDIEHPYLLAEKSRHMLQKWSSQEDEGLTRNEIYDCLRKNHMEELEEMAEELDRLSSDYPNDTFINIACGDICLVMGELDAAGEYYELVKECQKEENEDYLVKGKLADLAFCKGDYKAARDQYMELLKSNHYDNNVRVGMIRSNEELINGYKKKIEENPEDKATRLEMAWSCYQSYKFEDGIKGLEEFEPDEEQVCEYNNVKGRTYLCLSKYDKAIECFQKWKKEIERIKEYDADADLEKVKRYEYVNFLLGDCYLKKKKYEEARKYIEAALTKEHEEIVLSYEGMCELEYETGHYEACIDWCEKLLGREAMSYIAHSYMAKSFLNLNYANECIEACEQAIGIYPFISEPYVCEIKLFLRFDRLEQAGQVIKRYTALGVNSDEIKFYTAVVLANKKESRDALEILRELEKGYDKKDTDLDEITEVYMLKGEILQDMGMLEMAMAEYRKTIAARPDHQYVHSEMAKLQKKNGKLIEAIKSYELQIENNPRVGDYINKGLVEMYIKNYKSAMEDFKEAEKLAPEESFIYSSMALIYEYHREFKKAMENIDKALELVASDDVEHKKRYLLTKGRICQCTNQYEQAMQIYIGYIKDYDKDLEMAYDYSELLKRMNREEEALDICKECMRKCADSESIEENKDEYLMILRQLCSIYGSRGNAEAAAYYYRMAVQIDKNDFRNYNVMGDAYMMAELYREAAEMYRTVCQNSGGQNSTYLGYYYEALNESGGDVDGQERDKIEKVLDKKNAPLHLISLAKYLYSIGDMKGALAAIDKAIKSRRCQGCFYGRCHEALFEKGMLFESMKEYKLAGLCYREALRIHGHNSYYEKRLKRIEKKL